MPRIKMRTRGTHTSKRTTSINQTKMTIRNQLQDSANTEKNTARHQSVFSSELLGHCVTSNCAKETSSLESRHDVCFQSGKFVTGCLSQTEAGLERWKRHGPTNEGGIITKHGRTHSCWNRERIDPPVVDLWRGRVGGVVLQGEWVTHIGRTGAIKTEERDEDSIPTVIREWWLDCNSEVRTEWWLLGGMMRLRKKGNDGSNIYGRTLGRFSPLTYWC